ncbi:MAG: hypothetical protein JJU18_05730 [Oceanicaulis sp.]|nr:hypothetical protein [Oceanicaulis sp.]
MEALQEAAGEFLQERWAQLIVAFLFAGIGAFITTLRNRRKTADRIALELIATHEAMLARAFPYNGWRESDPREKWMLEPYVRRIDFLKDLAGESGLSANAVAMVRQYERALEDFIETWATTRRRRDGFQDALNVLTAALKNALNALRRLRKHRNDPIWAAGSRAVERQVQDAQRAALEIGPRREPEGPSSMVEGAPQGRSIHHDDQGSVAGEDQCDSAPLRS